MGIQAETPWALLLLLPWLIYMWWMARMTLRLRGTRKIIAILTRGLITLLLIMVAAGLQPYTNVKQRNVVFVADRSASMQADERISDWITNAWTAKGEDDRGGIVSVGLNAVVERPVAADALNNENALSFRANVNNHFTDLSQGLQLAAAMLPKAGGGRIVLLSDGAENVGDVRRQARLLKDAGILIDVVQFETAAQKDAAIEELNVPSVLKQGETFTFEIAINSTSAGSAQLRLFADNTELSVSEIQLEAGENRFALQTVALDPGFHRFRAEIYAPGDEQQENNAAHAFSRVSGPPAVLIVEGVRGSSANIEAALSASVIRHETIMPEQLSVELAEYAAYDSIILNNVPATRIAEKPMEWLAKAVGDYGVGLLMLGGEDSFGLGGYFKTPVERALPVYMDLQGKKQIPALGLILVIDRSGSMSDGKLELAKEAAMRTIELLRDVDTVGVVAFDSSPWWIVEPTKLTARDEVLEKVQGIQAEGGTEIYSALQAGYNGLLELKADRKHMILLTDGQSATNAGYGLLTDAMNENNMTLSTVAVGDGADQHLLKQLADDAKGRFYFTKDQSTLPSIFSRETVMMSRTYIVEQTFTPSIGQAGDWANLWQGGIPAINAYIATTAKETAEVALWSPDGDPLLARWPYGSGRTVAWTSDLTGKWSRDWVQWPALPKVLVEWVKWTFPQFESTPYTITTEMDGSQAKLRIRSDAGEQSAGSGLAAGIQDEAGNNEQLRLMPVAPGEYEANLSIAEPGVYLAQIGERTEGSEDAAIQEGTTAGFVIPYSPEFRLANEDGLATLVQVAATTGGRVLDPADPKQSFQFEPAATRQTYDWTRALLIAALLFWLVDIAIRRLSLPWARLTAFALQPFRIKERLAGSSHAPNAHANGAAASAISRLKQRTAETNRFYGTGAERPHTVEASNKVQSTASEAVTTAPHPSAPRAAPVIRSNKPEARLDRAKNNSSPNSTNNSSAAVPQSDGTINRLLAAKNKNKR